MSIAFLNTVCDAALFSVDYSIWQSGHEWFAVASMGFIAALAVFVLGVCGYFFVRGLE